MCTERPVDAEAGIALQVRVFQLEKEEITWSV
jgi:hypothetical protein